MIGAKGFPLIVKIQVVVAVVAVVVTVWAALQVVPLVEKKRGLGLEIQQLEAERAKLLADKRALTKEVEEAHVVGVDALGKSAPTTIPEELQQILKDVPPGVQLVPTSVKNREGWMVVLASHKNARSALNDLSSLRQRTDETVELYWAVNGYVTPALGVFDTRQEASAKQQQVRSSVKDAFVFGAWAFPYVLTLADR